MSDNTTDTQPSRGPRAIERAGGISADRSAQPVIEVLSDDVRSAVRGLRSNPGLTLTAATILGIGIGASAAMFSAVNAVLLRPLPFEEPSRLVWIENTQGARGLSERTSRADTVTAWRSENSSFTSIAVYNAFSDYSRFTLTGAGAPERLRGVAVSSDFLTTLGVQPRLGRGFTSDEARFNAPGKIVLAHDFWQRRFAGDVAIVGRALTLNGLPHTVVGILPRTFDFDVVFSPGSNVDFLIPLPLSPETARYGNMLFGIGRLRPGRMVDTAEAELQVISDRLRESGVVRGSFGARVRPLDSFLRSGYRPAFLTLAAAVLCALAAACLNVSGLLLARANSRRQEFAVRSALGAARHRLITHSLTETMLLASLGGLVGMPAAILATRNLSRLEAFRIPLLETTTLDPLALFVTIGLTTLAGVVCGVLPALHASDRRHDHALHKVGGQRSSGPSIGPAQNALIVGQVALACVLLIGASLLVGSLGRILRTDLGFDPEDAVVFRLDPGRGFGSGGEVEQYLGSMTRRVAALPGVEAVGLSDTLPLGRNRSWSVRAAGVEYEEGAIPKAYPRIVDSGYLQTMGISLVAGRHFDRAFDPKAPKAVIINETLARNLFGDRDPLGRKVMASDERTVIGVAGAVRHSTLEDLGGGEIYFDYRQSGDWNAMEMVIRSARSQPSLVGDVRAVLAAFDPALPTGEFYELRRLVDNSAGPRRFIAGLVTGFSGLSLALALIGLYGVIAHFVGRRSQEIGLRMAIGATRAHVLRLVVRASMKPVVLGVAVGLLTALSFAELIRSQLFGISPYDPATFAGIGALLLGAALVACLAPAFRATRIAPMAALRSE